jgi:undecaprenyl diphosphate synthase
VANLFSLLVRYLDSETEELLRSGVSLSAIGDLERLPPESRLALAQAMGITSKNTDLTLTLALSYGSRAELVSAFRDLAAESAKGAVHPEDIDESYLSSRLWSGKLPDLDLLIRTGGDKRVSNFLLWHLAYAELYFTDTLWPDFGPSDFRAAIEDFNSRKRRFGRAG